MLVAVRCWSLPVAAVLGACGEGWAQVSACRADQGGAVCATRSSEVWEPEMHPWQILLVRESSSLVSQEMLCSIV